MKMENNLKNVEEIKALLKEEKKFREFFSRYDEKTGQRNVDKFRAKFEVSNARFSCFKLNISFNAYTGVYGNSSCYTFQSFDQELANEYLSRWLNDNARRMFEELSDMIKADAAEKHRSAMQEINSLRQMVESLGVTTEADEDGKRSK